MSVKTWCFFKSIRISLPKVCRVWNSLPSSVRGSPVPSLVRRCSIYSVKVKSCPPDGRTTKKKTSSVPDRPIFKSVVKFRPGSLVRGGILPWPERFREHRTFNIQRRTTNHETLSSVETFEPRPAPCLERLGDEQQGVAG